MNWKLAFVVVNVIGSCSFFLGRIANAHQMQWPITSVIYTVVVMTAVVLLRLNDNVTNTSSS